MAITHQPATLINEIITLYRKYHSSIAAVIIVLYIYSNNRWTFLCINAQIYISKLSYNLEEFPQIPATFHPYYPCFSYQNTISMKWEKKKKKERKKERKRERKNKSLNFLLNITSAAFHQPKKYFSLTS